MRTLFVSCLLGAALLLVGCGTNSFGIAQKSPAELRTVSNADLCYAYRYWRSPQMLQEMARRNLKCEAQITADTSPATANRGGADPASASSISGIWRFSLYREERSSHFLRLTPLGPGVVRLEEGVMDDYLFKNRIQWIRPMLKGSAAITLTQKGGGWEGAFVSPNFRATHGREFTYRLRIEPVSSDRLSYAVWSSIRGETDTYAATRVRPG